MSEGLTYGRTGADPTVQDYLSPTLRVLADSQSRTSKQLREEVYDLMGLTEEQRAYTHEKSGQRRVDVRANFAVSHLRRAEALEGGYGVARITDVGRRLLAGHPEGLTLDDLQAIPAYRDYVPQKEGQLEAAQEEMGDQDEGEDTVSAPVDGTAWFVGAYMTDEETGQRVDRSVEFLREGRWGIDRDSTQKLVNYVKQMRVGDRIAIKSVYVRKQGVPFRTNGNPVSVMAIKAAGRITENPGDGFAVRVAWEQDFTDAPREWYFYTFQKTIWRLSADQPSAAALIRFAFQGVPQNIDAFRNAPYWADRFGDDAHPAAPGGDPDVEDPAVVVDVDDDEAPAYTTEGIIADGGFLEKDELEAILRTWRQKKNLILQGPPGTGKTWLAKRLARVLVGTADEDLITSVQFHPTVSYEDFVRGWRPAGDGTLTLVDGVLLQIAQRAAAEPDRVHVLVVEEINRGNLAQIFGEMLTLLEADKRTAEQAMRLAYMQKDEKPFHLPENLYVVGTMNLADRSLAMVDFALRRRFGFADLTPQFELPWVTWVGERVDGADEADVQRLGGALKALNTQIVAAPGLGEQYQIGHSFLTPGKNERGLEFRPWAESVIRQEIRPLLTEYWFDQPAQVDAAVSDLLAALPVTP
ncbi:AAA family ATPase [Micrococcus sp. NPDC078436]|uniref:AAA family ATPase n=1 Tax=Micrococcus sp. NPDC078436 TaxID=3154960 RepID=UPI00344F575C